jgi:ADP-L-glycero-D-manno-heptose 6-epimerase
VFGPLEDHKGNQASPITKFTQQAKDDGKITLFYGSDNYKRDFIFVGDVCEAHKQLMENKTPGLYNIGTGTASSFETVAEMISKKYSAEIKYIEMPDNLKGQYQEYTCADNKKLNNIVDIKYTTVEDFVNG